jgi:exopolyphosphatase/guanosine-5'-triphosphate,3'-diphosphate pyrophosphatase
VTRVAVVDLGTNSTRLLVADVENGLPHEVERRIRITKLGEAVDGGRHLLPQAIDRVHACLSDYRATIDRHAPDLSLAYATSAVRDAVNGDEFLNEVGRRFDLPTRLLTGDEEALLTFRGVAAGRDITEPTAIVDIGGGSTEIVLGNAAGVAFHASLDFGCVRLTERFVTADPAGSCDIEALVHHVRSLLREAVPSDALPAKGIGTAGTVTTLGTLHLGLPEEDPQALHGHRLPAAWIAAEAGQLAASSVAELRRRPGIAPERAQVIAAGAMALVEIMGFFELPELEVSESDILHGVALEAAALRAA